MNGVRTWPLWGGLLLLVARSVAAQPDDCQPLAMSSAAVVGERLGLDAAQLGWLTSRLAAGRLRTPDDLAAMPGMGTALRDELESAFCWGEGAANAGWSLYQRNQGAIGQREARVGLGLGPWQGKVRARRRSGEEVVLRGGLEWTRGSVRAGAGTVRAREGLGLLLQTPGGEVRGTAPLRPARSGWGASLALDPEVLRGAYVEWTPPRWRGSVAYLPAQTERPAFSVLTVDRTGPRGRVGVSLVAHPEGRSAGARLERAEPWGRWSAAWSTAAGRHAHGLTYEIGAVGWRFRGSWSAVPSGFALPHQKVYGRGESATRTDLRLDVRRQPHRDRFLRLAVNQSFRRESIHDPWPTHRSYVELEVKEKVATGARLYLLLRTQSNEPAGARSAAAEEGRVLRGELRTRRNGWRTRIRWETRDAGGGGAVVHAWAVGRGQTSAFALRGAVVRHRGQGASVTLYRRRAGTAHGWDVVGPGTWWGAWGRWEPRRARLEFSVDASPRGWDAVVAVHAGVFP